MINHPYPELITDRTAQAAAFAVCPVTLFNQPGRRNERYVCGQPVVRYGLCAKHAADKERLSR